MSKKKKTLTTVGQAKPSVEDQISYFKYAFDNVQSLAQFADSKANTLLTIHSIVLTLLSGLLLTGNFRDNIFDTSSRIEWVGLIIFILGLIAVLSSAVLVGLVIYPREAKKDKIEDEALFYYKRISQYNDTEEYFSSFEDLSNTKIAKALAHQSYYVSDIVDTKFTLIRFSLMSMGIYLLLIIISGFVFAAN